MLVNKSTLKWVMRFYPPLLFQRIWVVKFDPGFKGVHVRISKSFLNRNYNNSIFGGTIFAAADPFYPVLFHQIFTAKGYKVVAWLKSCQIQYIKPAHSRLEFKIKINDDDIDEMERELRNIGKFLRTYPVEMFNQYGELKASVLCEVYIRDLNKEKPYRNENIYE
ncbi:DUF4442 domain-containing protein [Mucilaginibacter hurinus]|uniref:DUF4442 domain-containing protein n=1 Tax=Mucilaginibacter hurinus TaxID=2201324 RepID=A0A367GSW3_9SPHI|nr:DUF4442 domain-containing protein [Mucilaginibacter hurinus]RCH55936.1 DUF4442 domain-containing protein [Mucilaginibacter hurinus]